MIFFMKLLLGLSVMATNHAYACYLSKPSSIDSQGHVTLRHVVNKNAGTITFLMKYDGLGWLALGPSTTGRMNGGTVVIAKTANALGASNPAMYSISSYSASGITLIPHQTLIHSSFQQTGSTTTLRFTEKYDPNAPETYIWAVGASDTFGYHKYRGSFKFSPTHICTTGQVSGQSTAQAMGSSPTDSSVVALEAIDVTTNTEKLWKAHGWLMGLAWVVIVPAGISASILRKMLPGNALWFTIHKANMILGFLMMTAGMAICLYLVISDEGSPNFAENRHRILGLIIYLFTIFQFAVGVFRPSLPHSKISEHAFPEKTVALDVEIQSEDTHMPTTSRERKSVQRILFEIGHRIVGFGLLGLSWYTVFLGIEIMIEEHGVGQYVMNAFWAIIAVIIGLVSVLFFIQTLMHSRKGTQTSP